MKSRRLKSEAQQARSLRAKYRKGAPINRLECVLAEIAADHYVIWNDRPMHPKFLDAMTLRTIKRAVLRGILFKAEIADDGAALSLPFGGDV